MSELWRKMREASKRLDELEIRCRLIALEIMVAEISRKYLNEE